MFWTTNLWVRVVIWVPSFAFILFIDLGSGHFSLGTLFALGWIGSDWVFNSYAFKEQDQKINRLRQEVRRLAAIIEREDEEPETGIIAK